MKHNLKAWQRKAIKKNMSEYRQALDNYYIKNKQVIELEKGYQAFSLLSPPIASPVARRRIKLIMSDLMANVVETEKGKSIGVGNKTPHFITMAITYSCQCKCLHCSAAVYQENVLRSGSELKFDEDIRIIKEMENLGATCIVFTGGEPLLHDRLFDLIKAVDKKKAICTIFTNGEYLNEKNVRSLKEAGVFGVFVSFDFADPEKHDANRKRKGIFEKAARGIKLCQENKILAGIATYATREKLMEGEMDAIMDLGKKLNVLEVFIFDVIPVGNLKGEFGRVLKENDFNEIKKLRAKYNALSDYPRIIHQTMLTSISYPCTGEGCPAGIAHVHIRANGDVSPCDFTPVSFGNLREKPLAKIWEAITSSEMYSKPSPCCRLSMAETWGKL